MTPVSHPRRTELAAREAAFAGAARVLAAVRRGRDELYVRGGAEAVARAAVVPGSPSAEDIAALYLSLRKVAEDRAG